MSRPFLFASALFLAFSAVEALGQDKLHAGAKDQAEAAESVRKAAEQAEQAGNLREAIRQYTSALQGLKPGSAEEEELRERIIGLARILDPKPSIPEEAERHMIRSATAARIAKTDKDIQEAITELEKALRLAPWVADGYFDLAILKERVNDYLGAIASFKLYLLTPRAAADASEVRKRIIALEYLAERSKKRPAAGAKSSVSAGAVSVPPAATVGDMWVYKTYATGAGWGTTQYRIIGIGDNEIRLERQFFQDRYATTLTKNWNLVSSVKTGSPVHATYSPFEPNYQFPLEPGKRWSQSYQEKGFLISFVHDLVAEVKGWDTITVPAGTFDVLRIDYTIRTTGSATQTQTRSIWYSPQVKWVVRDEHYWDSGNYRGKLLYELERYQVQ